MNLNYFQKSKLILIGLRGFSVLAKFIFTALFFKFSEESFGEYSLIATTILLLVFLLGLDFYSYANRAVLEPETNTQKIVFNQFSLYLILYIIMFPIVYLIFHLEQFNPEYQWLFYLVLITEHLNFEFYRLLFVFKKPTSANINIFLRNGLWVVFAGLQIYLNNYISIKEVLTYWLIGNVSALVYSLGISYGKRHKISLKNFKFDKNWIIKGLMVSIPYILATIFYKTIEFSDRFIIDYYMDKKAVGIYSFFANIANVLNIVLFTLVISVLYPTLVKTIITKDKSGFQKIYKQFKKEIYYYSTGMIVLLSIALPIILYIIDKNEYLKQFHIFLWLIFGNFLLNISMLYHFIIYAYKKDWLIFKATFLGAIINILLNILLIPIFGIAGASFATFASFLLIFFIKNKNARMHLFTS